MVDPPIQGQNELTTDNNARMYHAVHFLDDKKEDEHVFRRNKHHNLECSLSALGHRS